MFCMLLGHNTSIEERKLSGQCFFGGAIFEWLALFFEKNRNLQYLYVDKGSFISHLCTLADTLRTTKPSFRVIWLYELDIGDDLLRDLVEGFLACPTLEEVNLTRRLPLPRQHAKESSMQSCRTDRLGMRLRS